VLLDRFILKDLADNGEGAQKEKDGRRSAAQGTQNYTGQSVAQNEKKASEIVQRGQLSGNRVNQDIGRH